MSKAEQLLIDDELWRKLVRAAARRAMGLGTGEDISAWASEALSAGHDSPSLGRLAGLPPQPNEFEVDEELAGAMSGLGYSLPEREQLLDLYSRVVARDIVTGAIAPRDGAALLYNVFKVARSPELAIWTGLDDAVGLATQGIFGKIDAVERDIKDEAQKLLSR